MSQLGKHKNDQRSDRERVLAVTSRYYGVSFQADKPVGEWDYGVGLNGGKALKKAVQEYTVICPDCTNTQKEPVVAYRDYVGDDICPTCGIVCAGRDQGRWITYETPLMEKPTQPAASEVVE